MAWEQAESKEMEQIIPLYGKTYHMWQVDRGDSVPMGEPVLMGSFTSAETVKKAVPEGLDGLRKKTYERFGISSAEKEQKRKDLCPGFTIHPGMYSRRFALILLELGNSMGSAYYRYICMLIDLVRRVDADAMWKKK